MGASITKISVRFWSKVDKRSPDECWPWTGHCVPGGYGNFRHGSTLDGTRRKTNAHRMAWTLAFGEPAAGMFVMHGCDNRACCNPAHLRLGTHADNMRDMVSKGRSLRGERHYASKIADADRETAVSRALGGMTQAAVASLHGISRSRVGQLVAAATRRG